MPHKFMVHKYNAIKAVVIPLQKRDEVICELKAQQKPRHNAYKILYVHYASLTLKSQIR